MSKREKIICILMTVCILYAAFDYFLGSENKESGKYMNIDPQVEMARINEALKEMQGVIEAKHVIQTAQLKCPNPFAPLEKGAVSTTKFKDEKPSIDASSIICGGVLSTQKRTLVVLNGVVLKEKDILDETYSVETIGDNTVSLVRISDGEKVEIPLVNENSK